MLEVPADSVAEGTRLRVAVRMAAGIPVEAQRLLWGGCALDSGPLPPGLTTNPDAPAVRLLCVEVDWHAALNRVVSVIAFSINKELFDGPFASDDSLRGEDRALLEGNRDFLVAALQENGAVLRLLPDALRDDREVVLTAVRESGGALMFASEALRGDSEVVRAALAQNGTALEYASAELRRDPEIVLAALQSSGEAFRYVGEELKLRREVALAAVRTWGAALEEVPYAVAKERDFLLDAVRANGDALHHLPAAFRSDKEITMAAREFWAGRGADRDPSTIAVRAEHFLMRLPPPVKVEDRRAIG